MENEKIFCGCGKEHGTVRLENDYGSWLVCRCCDRAVENSFEYFRGC